MVRFKFEIFLRKKENHQYPKHFRGKKKAELLAACITENKIFIAKRMLYLLRVYLFAFLSLSLFFKFIKETSKFKIGCKKNSNPKCDFRKKMYRTTLFLSLFLLKGELETSFPEINLIN